MADENGYRVLVKEKIADAGVDLLREHFDVDVLHRHDARTSCPGRSATTTRS